MITSASIPVLQSSPSCDRFGHPIISNIHTEVTAEVYACEAPIVGICRSHYWLMLSRSPCHRRLRINRPSILVRSLLMGPSTDSFLCHYPPHLRTLEVEVLPPTIILAKQSFIDSFASQPWRMNRRWRFVRNPPPIKLVVGDLAFLQAGPVLPCFQRTLELSLSLVSVIFFLLLL